MLDLNKTPDLFPAAPPKPAEVQPLRILALDLATTTGWASIGAHGLRYGSFTATANKGAHPGQRFENYRAFLATRISADQPTVIVYEKVESHGVRNRETGEQSVGTAAAHLYGAWEAILLLMAARQRIRVIPLSVGSIKKHWTGKGNAKKPQMVAEARRRGFNPGDDNEADALAMLHLAMEHHA